MDHLPHDPAILVSSINMLLRDEEFDTLQQVCIAYNKSETQLCNYLQRHGYVYSTDQRQFRPIGYDQ